MRSVTLVVLLGACGRFDFDPHDAQYVSSVLADHPIAYYRLDEAGGPTAADASGNANDATYYSNDGGTISYASAGAIAGDPDRAVGLVGAGTADPVPPSQASLIFPPTVDTGVWGGDFTVEGWVKPDTSPTFKHAFFIWESYLVAGFRTGWNPDFTPVFWTHQSGGTTELDSPTPLEVHAWNHLVFTKSGVTVSIYINGKLDSSIAAVDYVTPPATAANGLGALNGLSSSGVFDELAIYDHALPPGRIAAHYATAVGS